MRIDRQTAKDTFRLIGKEALLPAAEAEVRFAKSRHLVIYFLSTQLRSRHLLSWNEEGGTVS